MAGREVCFCQSLVLVVYLLYTSNTYPWINDETSAADKALSQVGETILHKMQKTHVGYECVGVKTIQPIVFTSTWFIYFLFQFTLVSQYSSLLKGKWTTYVCFTLHTSHSHHSHCIHTPFIHWCWGLPGTVPTHTSQEVTTHTYSRTYIWGSCSGTHQCVDLKCWELNADLPVSGRLTLPPNPQHFLRFFFKLRF